MTVIIDGTTGISPVTASGTSASVDGLTVGRGGGEVATNTVVGYQAANSNTTGGSNVAVGTESLASNTTASYNTAVGYRASYSSVTGSQITAIGFQALKTNTGNYNSAFGSNSQRDTSTGAANTSVGVSSMLVNTTGSNNVAVGADALVANTTASNNTAVGYQAGYSNTTGTAIIAIGAQAGYSNTGGNANVFIGTNAGRSNTTSSGNVFVGEGAGYFTTGTQNTFIGAPVIGTAGCGQLVTTGSKNTILGAYSGNQGGLDIRTANNYIVLSDGDGNPRIWTDNTGLMYVPQARLQTTANASNLYVDSSYWIARSTSALKYKQDIRTLESIDVNKFRPVRYKSACENDDQEKDHFGIIADEVDEAGFKELVSYGAEGEVEGFQYERFTVVLLKAIQELNADLASTKLLLTEVSNKVEAQALEIKALKGTV